MLTNSMPFDAPNDSLLFNMICKGKFTCPDYLSPYCVSLISGLLNIKPDQRFSATQALDHPWFATILTPHPGIHFNSSNLVRYLKFDQVQKVLMCYIASHTSDAALLSQMNKFLKLNVSRTGVLSKEELSKWLDSFGQLNSEEVFRELNLNQSKGLSYLGIIHKLNLEFTAAFLPDHIVSSKEVLIDALEFFSKVRIIA